VGGNEAEMNGHGYEWKLISGSIIQKIDRKKFQTTSFAWSPRKRESEGKEEREGGGGGGREKQRRERERDTDRQWKRGGVREKLIEREDR